MIRGKDISYAVPGSMVKFLAAVLGNTTNAPTIPADGKFTPTTSTYPRRANSVSLVASEAPTRTSQGVYVITISHLLPNILFATAAVLSAGGSPTATLVADVTIINSATRQLTVKTALPNGTLTDVGTSDMIVIKIDGQDSGV